MAETEPVKPTKLYTVKDLKEHTTEDDCWIAINGKVYDVTHFLDEHPGGFDIIVTNTGALCSILKHNNLHLSVCYPLRCNWHAIVQSRLPISPPLHLESDSLCTLLKATRRS